nr:Glutathione S-transferase YfcF [Candidatus Pantoea persica]
MNYLSITLWSDSSFFSPYAMSVYVALTEKGIPFTLKRIDLAQHQQLSSDYRALSLTCRVPTL